MRTSITHKYVYRTFPKGRFNQLHKELSQYCNTIPPDGKIILYRKGADGFDLHIEATAEELENIFEDGNYPNELAFHYNSNHMYLNLDTNCKTLEISYLIFDSLEEAKKFIAFVERVLELKKICEHEVSESSDCQSQDTSDCLSVNNESPHSIWDIALKELQSLYSAPSFETWLLPIIASFESNGLVLTCPNEFFKDWILSRYFKDIKMTVQHLDPSVEEVIVRVGGKAVLSQETTNNQLFLNIQEPLLLELMKQVYEKETNNTVGCKSFDKYFNDVIESHCITLQERKS